MTDPRTPPQLPHHRLVAYQIAVELLLAIKAASIRDAKLRDEALRAAKSAVLNVAEGAGRVRRADKGRAFTIARGEGLEAFAALETAALVAEQADVQRCLPLPPCPVNAIFAPEMTSLAAGVIVRLGPTLTSTLDLLPSESVARTTSIVLPAVPATYAPLDGSIVPPEAVASDHV